MISSGRRFKWRLNDDAKRSSIWSSLPASQFPGDLAQLHAEHFPARRRVITTFCSTKAPLPLAFLIASCLLPHPPSLSVVTPFPLLLPSVFLSDSHSLSCTSQAPSCNAYSDWFVFVSCLWLQHLQTGKPWMVKEGVYLLTDNSEYVVLWIIQQYVIQTTTTTTIMATSTQKCKVIKSCLNVNHRRANDKQMG